MWFFVRIAVMIIYVYKYIIFVLSYNQLCQNGFYCNDLTKNTTVDKMDFGFNCYTECIFVLIFVVDSEFRQVIKEFVMFKILRRIPTKEQKEKFKSIMKNIKIGSEKNSFLHASVNLESVCSILNGLN